MFVSVSVHVPIPTSTENERNHQPNLLLYILFIYGLMGCNFIFGWKIGENVEFGNENYF